VEALTTLLTFASLVVGILLGSLIPYIEHRFRTLHREIQEVYKDIKNVNLKLKLATLTISEILIRKKILNALDLLNTLKILILEHTSERIIDYLPENLRKELMKIFEKDPNEVDFNDIKIINEVGNYLIDLGEKKRNEKIWEIGNKVQIYALILETIIRMKKNRIS